MRWALPLCVYPPVPDSLSSTLPGLPFPARPLTLLTSSALRSLSPRNPAPLPSSPTLRPFPLFSPTLAISSSHPFSSTLLFTSPSAFPPLSSLALPPPLSSPALLYIRPYI